MSNHILLIKAERLTLSSLQVCPPLGLLYISSVAEKSGDFHTHILDLRVIKESRVKSTLLEAVKLRPFLVGFSCLSNQFGVLRDLVKFLRKYLPETPFVLGGPLASSEPEMVLKSTSIDLCVYGEGEITFQNLLTRLSHKQKWDDLNGIAFRSEGKVIINPPEKPIEDLDQLPFIPWEKIDLKVYSRYLNCSGLINYYAPIISSRGCPYQCIFCYNIFGRKYRSMSVNRILAEIEILYTKYNVRRIEFNDDIFNLDKDRCLKILEGLGRNFPKMKVSLPGLRVDKLDEELISAMAKARCYSLGIAIETASPRLQKLIGKNLDLDKASQNIALIKKYKIPSKGLFMLGLPTETMEEAMETYRFAVRHPIDFRLFLRTTPFPGTILYQKYCDKNKIFEYEDLNFLINPELCSEVPEQLYRKIERMIFFKNLTNWKNARLVFDTARALFRFGNPVSNAPKYVFRFRSLNSAFRQSVKNALRDGYKLSDKD